MGRHPQSRFCQKLRQSVAVANSRRYSGREARCVARHVDPLRSANDQSGRHKATPVPLPVRQAVKRAQRRCVEQGTVSERYDVRAHGNVGHHRPRGLSSPTRRCEPVADPDPGNPIFGRHSASASYGRGFSAAFRFADTSYGGGTRAQIPTASPPMTYSGVGCCSRGPTATDRPRKLDVVAAGPALGCWASAGVAIRRAKMPKRTKRSMFTSLHRIASPSQPNTRYLWHKPSPRALIWIKTVPPRSRWSATPTPDASVTPDNNGSERDLRPTATYRKVTGGIGKLRAAGG
jgi:hypothetical protein